MEGKGDRGGGEKGNFQGHLLKSGKEAEQDLSLEVFYLWHSIPVLHIIPSSSPVFCGKPKSDL